MATPAKILRSAQAQTGNLVMALCAMISALMRLRHVNWVWLPVVAAAWLAGHFAKSLLNQTKQQVTGLSGIALFYALSLIGTAICYGLGIAVSLL